MSKIVAPGHGRTPKQARSVDRRERILTAAAEVFNQVGYAGSSLNLIADAAGVSKGAVQFQFKTKEEVARAVIDEEHATVMSLAREVSESDGSAIEQAVMLSHMMAELLVTSPIVRGGIRLTIELAFTDEGPVGPYQEWVSACEGLFRRAQTCGELAAGIDPGKLALHVAGAFTGIQIMSHVLTKRADLDERLDDMWRHLLAGILETSHRDQRRVDEITAARWVREDRPQVEHFCSTCGRLHN